MERKGDLTELYAGNDQKDLREDSFFELLPSCWLCQQQPTVHNQDIFLVHILDGIRILAIFFPTRTIIKSLFHTM